MAEEPEIVKESSDVLESGEYSEQVQSGSIECDDLEAPVSSSMQWVRREPEPESFVICVICKKVKKKSNTKRVSSYDEKVIIALGCCLRKKLPIEECQKLTTRSQPPVCLVHTVDAVHDICEAIRVKSTRELLICTSSLLDDLMVTVGLISRHVNSTNFGEKMYRIITRNKISLAGDHIQEKRKEPIKQLPEEPIRHVDHRYIRKRCAVCSDGKSPYAMKDVELADDKLIVMIGRYLCGYCTLAAGRISTNLTGPIRICHKHFREASQAIQTVLEIRNGDEMVTYSEEAMSQLILIVNELRPLISTPQFITIFQDVVARNQDSIEFEPKRYQPNLFR